MASPVVRGAGRTGYRVTALATLVLVLGATVAIASLWPKTYEADGRLLLQRNEVMASLVNPGRTIPREAESPTAAAREIVLGRENVLALMKATNLLEEWARARRPLLRFKDWLFGLIGSAPTEDDRIDALAGLIESRLQVGTSDEGIVSFSIRWPDAQMAYHLVDEAMNSFLQYRRVSETAAITESIAILNRSAETLESQVSETIAPDPAPIGAAGGNAAAATGDRPVSAEHGAADAAEVRARVTAAGHRPDGGRSKPATVGGTGAPHVRADDLHRGPSDGACPASVGGAVVARLP